LCRPPLRGRLSGFARKSGCRSWVKTVVITLRVMASGSYNTQISITRSVMTTMRSTPGGHRRQFRILQAVEHRLAGEGAFQGGGDIEAALLPGRRCQPAPRRCKERRFGLGVLGQVKDPGRLAATVIQTANPTIAGRRVDAVVPREETRHHWAAQVRLPLQL